MRPVPGFEETLSHPDPTPEPGPPLAERLHAYARLLALAADELAALEQGDLAKRRELSEARETLTREIRDAGRTTPVEEDEEEEAEDFHLPLPEKLAGVCYEALEALELRDAEERQMQDRWSSLEGDALRAIHVGGRIVSLRGGRYPVDTPIDTRLDVRF